MLTQTDIFLKRCFDLFFSAFGFLLFLLPLLILIIIATISLKKWGLFRQLRIGMHGKKFWMYKIRTMKVGEYTSTITVKDDPRVDSLGRFLRRTKLDELPQLFNVLKGDMSLVGPRPDVPGYADELTGEDRIILSVRPGITGPATLKYKDEEQLLGSVSDPVEYNDEVIWKDKVRINKRYINNWSLKRDIQILFDTIFV
jgi:lipopolysaccharide/colanic/teichoic acid biosynthesis glycosyltransferase